MKSKCCPWRRTFGGREVTRGIDNGFATNSSLRLNDLPGRSHVQSKSARGAVARRYRCTRSGWRRDALHKGSRLVGWKEVVALTIPVHIRNF